jgi:beta-aspartyl-peptidase (threonine type)
MSFVKGITHARPWLALVLGMAALSAVTHAPAHAEERRMFAIAIHGGAGTIERSRITPEQDLAFRSALNAAVEAGYAILEKGGSSLDAVSAAVRILEDDPQFNAGRGAVLTHDGRVELDASIMDGRNLRAGAVTGVQHVRSPIELARRIMEQSRHVMLSGAGAEEFALEQKLELVPNSWFITPRRRDELKRALAGLPPPPDQLVGMGTVGAVALDASGNLAAATSTGGMTNKRWGRIGDSPIIGAGTYANNASCAVSATGHGEYFIRYTVAHDICAIVEYRNWSLERAAREVVQNKLKQAGGDGGIIAVDARGNVVMEFNSDGMFRAMRDSRGRREIAIYRE